MGTETRVVVISNNYVRIEHVKLNNPQMGTETVINIQREHFIVVN